MSKKDLVINQDIELKVGEYVLLYDKTIVKITAWCEECEPREIYFAYRRWDRLKFKRKSAWVRETDIVGYGKTLKAIKRVRKLLKKEKPLMFRKKSKVKEGENDESI